LSKEVQASPNSLHHNNRSANFVIVEVRSLTREHRVLSEQFGDSTFVPILILGQGQPPGVCQLAGGTASIQTLYEMMQTTLFEAAQIL